MKISEGSCPMRWAFSGADDDADIPENIGHLHHFLFPDSETHGRPQGFRLSLS